MALCAQHSSCPRDGTGDMLAQILLGEETSGITDVGRAFQRSLLFQAHVEEPGRSGLGRGLVEWKQRAAGVLGRTQQTRLSLECKMEKVRESEHGRMTLAGQGAVSELEVTCAGPGQTLRVCIVA